MGIIDDVRIYNRALSQAESKPILIRPLRVQTYTNSHPPPVTPIPYRNTNAPGAAQTRNLRLRMPKGGAELHGDCAPLSRDAPRTSIAVAKARVHFAALLLSPFMYGTRSLGGDLLL
jgi:hypothetical protein